MAIRVVGRQFRSRQSDRFEAVRDEVVREFLSAPELVQAQRAGETVQWDITRPVELASVDEIGHKDGPKA